MNRVRVTTFAIPTGLSTPGSPCYVPAKMQPTGVRCSHPTTHTHTALPYNSCGLTDGSRCKDHGNSTQAVR